MRNKEHDREYRKKVYHERIEKGLCARCGGDNDSKYHSCLKCRMAMREERAFLRSIGICPKCRKNRLIGDQRVCDDCAVKSYESNIRYREKLRTRNA